MARGEDAWKSRHGAQQAEPSRLRRTIRLTVAVGLLVDLVGCSLESLESRAQDVKNLMKRNGLETHHGKLIRVFRF